MFNVKSGMLFTVLFSLCLGIGVVGCERKAAEPEDTSTSKAQSETSQTTKSATDQVAKANDGYPLTTCVVSGEKLGGHGDPYIHTHEGVEVRFCCKPCLKDFNAEPEKYVAMIKAGSSKATETTNDK